MQEISEKRQPSGYKSGGKEILPDVLEKLLQAGDKNHQVDGKSSAKSPYSDPYGYVRSLERRKQAQQRARQRQISELQQVHSERLAAYNNSSSQN